MNYYLDYNGIQADIFSLGVVLLYLISNESGFLYAKKIDPQYKLIAYNNEKAFKEKLYKWKTPPIKYFSIM